MVPRLLIALSLALSLALASCAPVEPPASRSSHGATDRRPLRIASWNLEFLAEKDGAGCNPREPADYQAMRRIVDGLDADVVAFQEAESLAAAARVFDPRHYLLVMEARPGDPSGTCGGEHPDQPFIRQAVGFAIRKGIAFDHNPDVTSLMIRNSRLRSGVDVTIRARGHAPIRLLGIHLKSGCSAGDRSSACPTLFQQVPAVEAWIDAAARGPVRFAVLGDWNRRLAMAGDQVWTEIDDGEPANADLRLAAGDTPPGCDPRYNSFIDHIALDRGAGRDMIDFAETRYAGGEKHFSDHCPVLVTLAR